MDENIAIELRMLKTRFPNVEEYTLDEYASYFGIKRRDASRHFQRRAKQITHKRIGRDIRINSIDFAYYLAQQKVVGGRQIVLTPDSLKRKRGFQFQSP